MAVEIVTDYFNSLSILVLGTVRLYSAEPLVILERRIFLERRRLDVRCLLVSERQDGQLPFLATLLGKIGRAHV